MHYRQHVVFVVLLLLLGHTSVRAEAVPAAEGTTPEMNLVRARLLAVDSNPVLKELRAALGEARAAIHEARLLPNPELETSVEDLPPSFDVDQGKLTTLLSESIVTGGKRGLRIAAARAAFARSEAAYEQAVLEVTRDVTRAFCELIGSRLKVEATRELGAVAEEFRSLVAKRAGAGQVRPIEVDRADVLAFQVSFETRRAESDVEGARHVLAAAIGIAPETMPVPSGSLPVSVSLPALQELEVRSRSAAPSLRIPQIEETIAEKELALARAQAIPDVSVGVGVQRRGSESPDGSADMRTFRIALPLPVFNSGQAARERAHSTIDVARSRQVKAWQALRSRLAQAYVNARRTGQQIDILESRLLPIARRAVTLSIKGYWAGKFTYLDVLDAQRSLTTTTQEYIDTRIEQARALAELEEITVGGVRPLPTQTAMRSPR